MCTYRTMVRAQVVQFTCSVLLFCTHTVHIIFHLDKHSQIDSTIIIFSVHNTVTANDVKCIVQSDHHSTIYHIHTVHLVSAPSYQHSIATAHAMLYQAVPCVM